MPNARTDAVVLEGDGTYRVRVRAAAVDDKANDALRRLLVKHFGVRRCAVTIVRGAHARAKTMRIDARVTCRGVSCDAFRCGCD